MNKLDKAYTDLLQDIIDNGTKKEDRTGTGTISVFGRQIRHKMSEGFPLLTTKKMAFKTMVTELIWFLRGDTSIEYLLENDCHIWDGDAYKNWVLKNSEPDQYWLTKEEFINRIKTDEEFAKKWGNLGKSYGYQWRSWGGFNEIPVSWEHGAPNKFESKPKHDQIVKLINDLKTNPNSRRLIVSAWAVHDLPNMTLPPCHFSFQVYTRELSQEERWTIRYNYYPKDRQFPWDRMALPPHTFLDNFNIPSRAISLMFNMRSTDVGLGLSFNLASYGLLLMMIAKQVNMVPDELIYNGGDVHLYLNHIEPIKEQLTREPYTLPNVILSDREVKDISEYTLDDITLENYQYHPTIKMPLSN